MPNLRIYSTSSGASLPLFTGDLNLTDWNTISTDEPEVTEKMRIVVNVADSEALLQTLAALDTALRGSVMFANNNTFQNSYWLEVVVVDSLAQRALLFAGEYTRTESNGVYALFDGEPGRAVLQVVADRGVWESSQPRPVAIGRSAAPFVVTSEGTLNGRINRLTISAENFVADIADRVWVGILPLRAGQTTSDFVSMWEAARGSGSEGVVNVEDATVQGDRYVAINMSVGAGLGDANTLYWRHVVRLWQVYRGDNWIDFAGRFNVLLRLKIAGAGAKMRVQVRAGVGNNTTILGELWLDDTNSTWNVYELRGMHLPGYSVRSNSLWSFDKFGIELYIQDLTGQFSAAHQLHYNFVRLLPADHFVELRGENLIQLAHTNARAHVLTHEDGEVVGIGEYVGQGAAQRAELSMGDDWSMPQHGGVVVMESARTDSHEIGHSFNIEVEVTDRWRGLRQPANVSHDEPPVIIAPAGA